MVVLLGEEQKDDDAQKSWCETEFESSGDKEVDLKHKLEGLTAAIEEMSGSIDTLKGEIKALEDGIVALDKSVAEATETRKAEHEEFVTVAAQNNAAVQLLGVAENRLNKFYNPAAYKPPQRRELTEEERIYVQSGGADPRDAEEAAAAQTGIAGTGITALSQAAPPPPPATAGAYKKKSAGGPTALIQKLANELKMEVQANEMDEKNAQEDYEELMAESASKRAADSKTITEKETQKAGLDGGEVHEEGHGGRCVPCLRLQIPDGGGGEGSRLPRAAEHPLRPSAGDLALPDLQIAQALLRPRPNRDRRFRGQPSIRDWHKHLDGVAEVERHFRRAGRVLPAVPLRLCAQLSTPRRVRDETQCAPVGHTTHTSHVRLCVRLGYRIYMSATLC